MLVEDVMKKPVFVSSLETLDKAAQIMAKHNLNGLLVGTDKALEGLLTKEDLVKHFGHKERVQEIMTKSILTIGKGGSIQEVAEVIKKNRINFVPVLDKKKVVGVISSKDILEVSESSEEGDDFLIG